MSLQIQCPECGQYYSIGAPTSLRNNPCNRCKQKKAQFAAEIDATYPKAKCPVFGCTIPRGIPHEHPAGVSAVMRDPVAPLNADERAELERYRAEDEQDRRTVFLRANKNSKPTISLADMHARYAEPGSLREEAIRRSNVYVVPADAPIHAGSKLRDALLMAGHKPGDTLTFEESKPAPPTHARPVGRQVHGLDVQHSSAIAGRVRHRLIQRVVGMITAYFLVAFFAFGALCGMTYKDQAKPPASEWALMLLMAVCWPALIYVFWLQWRDEK